MTRRKRLLLGLTGSVAICCAIVAYACLFPPVNGNGITEENYDKLRKGMTLREVELTLGAPPGNYSDAAPFWEGATVKSLAGKKNAPSHVWLGKELSVGIWLDEAGAVTEMTWVKYAYQGNHWGWQQKLRHRLRL